MFLFLKKSLGLHNFLKLQNKAKVHQKLEHHQPKMNFPEVIFSPRFFYIFNFSSAQSKNGRNNPALHNLSLFHVLIKRSPLLHRRDDYTTALLKSMTEGLTVYLPN